MGWFVDVYKICYYYCTRGVKDLLLLLHEGEGGFIVIKVFLSRGLHQMDEMV